MSTVSIINITINIAVIVIVTIIIIIIIINIIIMFTITIAIAITITITITITIIRALDSLVLFSERAHQRGRHTPFRAREVGEIRASTFCS
jgi:type IV secretory pathway VirB3-like protein